VRTAQRRTCTSRPDHVPVPLPHRPFLSGRATRRDVLVEREDVARVVPVLQCHQSRELLGTKELQSFEAALQPKVLPKAAGSFWDRTCRCSSYSSGVPMVMAGSSCSNPGFDVIQRVFEP
jgi:hypothetical protein